MRQRVLNSILDFRRNEGKGQRRYFNAFFQQLARFVGGHFSVNLLLALLAIMHGAGAVREVPADPFRFFQYLCLRFGKRRSAERRLGKEWVSTCRSRGGP